MKWFDLGALFTPSEKTKLAGIDTGAKDDQTGAEIKTAYEAEANAYTDTKNTKLAGIDTGAKDDQTGAEIKTAYQAQANAYTDTKNTKLAGIATAATKYPDTGEQAFLDADHTKLNGIDTGAKDDQTGAEIKTAYEAEANAYTDTKNTKLAGIATGADVTGDNAPQAHGASVHTDRTRTIFLSAGDAYFSDGAITFRGLTFDPTSKEDSRFKFKLPDDFVSISDIKIIGYRSGGVTGGVVFDVTVELGDMLSGSETYAAHSNTDLDIIITVSSANIIATDVANSVLANVTNTDLITFKLERDVDHASDDLAVDYIVAGILITYTADM